MPLRRSARIRSVAESAGLTLMCLLAGLSSVLGQTAVLTYHNNNYRTGWNSTETTLTPANVTSSQFGLLTVVNLDDEVDAEPLLVPSVNITSGNYKGQHDVVYIVTGSDTVYAIDANVGTVLLTENLGTPVPEPLGCNNNGPNVGITSTPVIDTSSNTIYLIAYVLESTGPAYYLHALDLGSLADEVPPVLIAASHTLTNGTTFVFNAKYQRQRPALLEANGNIYAGFGSFCDFSANISRGWLLGWNTGTLEPVTADQLFDIQATDPDTFFLSSIWMSGYGLAADDSGNVVFVTGNSDWSGTTYDGVTNIQESVIKVSPDLTTVVDLFTPMDWSHLDETDGDFGSGGAMILPDQAGLFPHLAVAAGKAGTMFFMNEDSLGGYSPTQNNVLGSYAIGACWCGESYFVDPSDAAGRVVSSGGDRVEIWKLFTSPSPKLTPVAQSAVLHTGQNGGFFTSVSSNGTANPIIWAVSRPVYKTNGDVYLYAFNPESSDKTMTTLFSAAGGYWPNINGDSNLVPLVANGKVYVASYQQLRIFGLKQEAPSK
jgi:hypothetical protein